MDGSAKSPRYATISSTSNASNVKNSMVEVISLTLPYGGDGSLNKAIGLYDKLNKFSTKGVALSGIPSLLHLATNAMAYAWLFLAMRSVVVRSLRQRQAE